MKVQTADAVSLRENGVTETALSDLHLSLRKRFGETAYRRWLEPMTGEIACDASGKACAALVLPTRFMRDWVEAHYGEMIGALWQQITPGGAVSFAVLSPLSKATQAKNAIDAAVATPACTVKPYARFCIRSVNKFCGGFVGRSRSPVYVR
jgi:chromosomal replication initiation ATPase DnaA